VNDVFGADVAPPRRERRIGRRLASLGGRLNNSSRRGADRRQLKRACRRSAIERQRRHRHHLLAHWRKRQRLARHARRRAHRCGRLVARQRARRTLGGPQSPARRIISRAYSPRQHHAIFTGICRATRALRTAGDQQGECGHADGHWQTPSSAASQPAHGGLKAKWLTHYTSRCFRRTEVVILIQTNDVLWAGLESAPAAAPAHSVNQFDNPQR
jgi:hypothetical protein